MSADAAIDPRNLPPQLLAGMAAAGQEYRACRAALTKAGKTIVEEIVGSHVESHVHYPPGDVYDADTHSQYYFHIHRPADYGHFHTFLRARGMPAGMQPAEVDPAESAHEMLCHLVAIGLDHRGEPGQLFTTNRWVTAETWYRAADVAAMLPRFRIFHGSPSTLANRWVSALMTLFRPQIERLLAERDTCVAKSRAGRAMSEVLEDRSLEITSLMTIDIDNHIDDVERALGG